MIGSSGGGRIADLVLGRGKPNTHKDISFSADVLADKLLGNFQPLQIGEYDGSTNLED